MAIDRTKAASVGLVRLLYRNLRDLITDKYTKPESGIPASDLASGVIPDISSKADVSVTNHLQVTKAPVIVESVSGNPIVFHDGADGLPIQSLKLTLLPRQSGSGDASPENVRPLIPWENVGMWTGGSNLCYDSSITFYRAEKVNGEYRSTDTDTRPQFLFAVQLYDENKTYIKTIGDSYADIGIKSRTFIVDDANVKYVCIKHVGAVKSLAELYIPFNYPLGEYTISANVVGNDPTVIGGIRMKEIQLFAGDTVYPYAEPIITPHPVDLSSIITPVYGCEVNLITGEVWGTFIASELIAVGKQGNFFYNTLTSLGLPNIKGTNKGLVCDRLRINPNTSESETTDSITVYSNGIIRFVVPEFINSTVQEFNEGTKDNRIQFAYELATPVLLATLTPQEIETLLGTNTIWSDADSIDVEYRADTELFINQNGVKDVRVNGTSVTADGVANVPMAGNNRFGVVKPATDRGTDVSSTGYMQIVKSQTTQIKAGTDEYRPIVPYNQHESAFYGLAKLAGADMAQSSNAVGTYTDAAKQGIQKMLGLAGLLGPYEDDITADRAYAIGETFVMDGKRYKATAAIAQGGIITPGTNCELCPLSLSDIQINGTSILQNGIANIPIMGAGAGEYGVARTDTGFGTGMASNGAIAIVASTDSNIKVGTDGYRPIVARTQHKSIFYGLAKLAGVDLANGSDVVGVYPQNAKDAIQSMLGIEALPAVAAADNGKILQVVNGEWAAASIPNANGVSF